MTSKYQLGKKSEKKVEDWFLRSQNSVLLKKNYRCKWGEIDLIFEEHHLSRSEVELVFVEVRSRSQEYWIDGPKGVSLRKQSRLRRTAMHFLSSYRGRAKTLRFDLVYRDGKSWGYLRNFWVDY